MAEFGPRLPFLLKVLAADQAAVPAGAPDAWSRRGPVLPARTAAGVPADAPNRNYRDDNHKPEMIFALTPFEALCGFRPAARSPATSSCTWPAAWSCPGPAFRRS